MLFVLKPLTDVSGTIRVLVCSVTMRLVIEPHAFVNISICMNEGAHSVGLIVLPHAIVA